MSVEHLEVFVEEPSMEAFLRIILPQVLGLVTFEIYRFQSKSDLLKKLPNRLRAYQNYLPPTSRILVVLDRDDDDCVKLLDKVHGMVRAAKLKVQKRADDMGFHVVVRLAIEELEAWYFGDWDAVAIAFPGVSSTIDQKAKFRSSDEIAGGTWEAFERVLQKAGHFKGGLRKIEAARAIASHLSIDRNRSPSFRKLVEVLQKLSN